MGRNFPPGVAFSFVSTLFDEDPSHYKITLICVEHPTWWSPFLQNYYILKLKPTNTNVIHCKSAYKNGFHCYLCSLYA